MARAGRKERNLLSKPASTGKLMWYIRLYHEGLEEIEDLTVRSCSRTAA